jgi:23S rRNA-/tRNA-specific pseudouridylate synthase
MYLQSLFKSSPHLQKTYWAFIEGQPNPQVGKVKVPLEKIKVNGQEKVVCREQGEGNAKMSVTEFKSLQTTKEVSVNNYIGDCIRDSVTIL